MRKYGFVYVGMVALMATFHVRAAVSSKDAFAIYLLDEGAGTAISDKSANANNATLSGNGKWVDGKFGKGLEFADGVSFTSTTAKGVRGSQISECLWAKFSAFDTEAQFGYINATGQPSTRFFYFSTWCPSAPHNCVHLGTLKLDGGWGRGIVTPPVFETDKWYFICGVVDNVNGKVQAYVDGALTLSQDFDKGDTPGTPNAIWVGSSPEKYQVAKAVFDDIGFFSVALTEADMKMLMSSGISAALLGGATAVDPQAKLATTWAAVKSR